MVSTGPLSLEHINIANLGYDFIQPAPLPLLLPKQALYSQLSYNRDQKLKKINILSVYLVHLWY